MGEHDLHGINCAGKSEQGLDRPVPGLAEADAVKDRQADQGLGEIIGQRHPPGRGEHSQDTRCGPPKQREARRVGQAKRNDRKGVGDYGEETVQ